MAWPLLRAPADGLRGSLRLLTPAGIAVSLDIPKGIGLRPMPFSIVILLLNFDAGDSPHRLPQEQLALKIAAKTLRHGLRKQGNVARTYSFRPARQSSTPQ